MKNKRKRQESNKKKFYSGPFTFAREVLDGKVKGDLVDSKERVEEFLREAHSDEHREEELPEMEGLYTFPEPTEEFDLKPPTLDEVRTILKKARLKSAAGPNGIPYKVYKKCPGVAKLLWSYLKGIWKKQKVAKVWRKANGIFIPKEQDAKSVEKFRTISLLNVEGKIYFGILSKRITKYLMKNYYIDTSIQKGGIPGISGCLEHTSLLSQLIREAKAGKKDLAVIWLDIANAYGSVPHQLIKQSLKRMHMPEEVTKVVSSYYEDMNIRFSTKQYTTSWQRIERGIITGCTLSAILFVMSMTMLLMSVQKETKGPKTASGALQRNARLYMDDITTTTATVTQTNYLLKELAMFLNWARLKVKVSKCRSLVIKNGAVTNFPIRMEGEVITGINQKPIKYLGKVYDFTLEDSRQVKGIIEATKKGIKKISKSLLNGSSKAWISEHMLLPRLMWPLSIYSIPMTAVEEVEKLITGALKKWLGLPKSLTGDALYMKSCTLQLPYKSVVEEVKATKVRNLLTLRESSDKCISEAEIEVITGRKWKAAKAVDEATSSLKLKDIAGIANIGREGLGWNKRQYFNKSRGKDRRDLMIKEVRQREDEARGVRMTRRGQQGGWMRWEVPQRKISHQELWSTSEKKVSFLIKAVYDILPTPANKNRWFNTQEHKCKLCGGTGTLQHILNSCKVALQQGRYTWRHNRVLREIADLIDSKRRAVNKATVPKKKGINFVRSGDIAVKKRQVQPEDSYLHGARDWEMKVDLDRQLSIPTDIACTNQRPDLIIYSRSSRKIAIIELTVPGEERVGVANELKKLKYTELEEECKRKGFVPRIWAVEIGSRGFPASSMSGMLKDFGLTGRGRKDALKKLSQTAVEASQVLWWKASVPEWGSIH